jgi:hypothetical protein
MQNADQQRQYSVAQDRRTAFGQPVFENQTATRSTHQFTFETITGDIEKNNLTLTPFTRTLLTLKLKELAQLQQDD